jgi:hypothetical protein
MRRATVVVGSIAGVLLAATTAWALATPSKVIVRPGAQWFPFGDPAYLAYASNSVARPKHWDVFAIDRTTQAVRRVNAAGTIGFPGGFDPGTNSLLYQQVDGSASDLYFFDLDTRSRTKARGVDSGDWEWDPRISSSSILFLRDEKLRGIWYTSVYHYDRASLRLRRLKQYRWSKDASVETGSVGDRYAAWVRCTSRTCKIFLWDRNDRSIRALPTKNGRPQYAPVLDEVGGQLFFVRSGFGCGVQVNIFRASLDPASFSPVKVADLPDRIEVGGPMSLAPDPGTGAQDLLFTRLVCGKSSDIYSLRGAVPAPLP